MKIVCKYFALCEIWLHEEIVIFFPLKKSVTRIYDLLSISWEKVMAPHSSTLARKIPWMEKPGRLQSMGSLESDMTERLHFQFSLSCIGEGNGNPLQCSCLENPRDGEAWWAAIYGVAWSRTRLKWLSSNLAAPSAEGTSFLVQSLSCTHLFASPWIIAHQAPLSMGFSRQEYWIGLPPLSLGHLLRPGMKTVSPALAGEFFTTEPPGKPEGMSQELLIPNPIIFLLSRSSPAWIHHSSLRVLSILFPRVSDISSPISLMGPSLLDRGS